MGFQKGYIHQLRQTILRCTSVLVGVYYIVYILLYIYSGFGKSRNRTIKLTDERIS
jgi:hypothetical protein